MLYFWITNASRAHRAGRSNESGKGTPINCSGKGNFHRKRKKELSVSSNTSCSETQLDKILQKETPSSSLNGSNSQVTMPNGSVDIPWIKSRSRGSVSPEESDQSSIRRISPEDGSVISQKVQSYIFSHPFAKQKIYTRKSSSTSLW